MGNPKLSVIIPVYNDTEKFLPRCIESIINQTFKDLEIICVVDGSPDNSLAICNGYKEKDKRVIVTVQKNQGLSGARNTGIANASGTYIQFCDPDDYFTPDMCEKMHNAITLSNADIVVAGTRVVCDQPNDIPGDIEYYRVKNRGLCPVNEVVVRTTDASVWNKLYKKSIIDLYDIRFPRELLYEDVSFFYKYMFASKTAFFIPEKLYVYVSREQPIMAKTFSKTPKIIDCVKILFDIKDFMYKYNFKGIYETDIFLWLVVSFFNFVFTHGVKSIYDSTIEIPSDLLADIPVDFIQSSPYVTANEKAKLISLKKKDKDALLRFSVREHQKQKLKSDILPFFPYGSNRRRFLRKIYKMLTK